MIELTQEITRLIGAEGKRPIPTNAAVRSLATFSAQGRCPRDGDFPHC